VIVMRGVRIYVLFFLSACEDTCAPTPPPEGKCCLLKHCGPAENVFGQLLSNKLQHKKMKSFLDPGAACGAL